MKPVLFGPFPPPTGGVATFFTRLCTLLNERGYAYELKRFGGQADPIHETWSSWNAHLDELHRGRIFFDSGTSFIENPSRKPMLLWWAFRHVRRFHWIKLLHSGTLPLRYQTFTFQQRLLFHANLRSVDTFITVNDSLATWLRDTLGVRQPVHVINSLLPMPSYMSQARLELPHADKRVCTIGVFTENYGFEEVANAVELLRQRSNQNIQLAILDAAFARDDAYRQRVLAGRDWIVNCEALPPESVYSVLRQSDLFVRATRKESYGLSKIEALWCGVPVLCVEAGETRGMTLYQAGNLDDLTTHISAMLSAPPSTVSEWAAFYMNQAEANLLNFIQLIYGTDDAR